MIDDMKFGGCGVDTRSGCVIHDASIGKTLSIFRESDTGFGCVVCGIRRDLAR